MIRLVEATLYYLSTIGCDRGSKEYVGVWKVEDRLVGGVWIKDRWYHISLIDGGNCRADLGLSFLLA